MTNKSNEKTNRWRVDPATILDVIATDFFQVAIVSAIDGDKLSDDREWASAVYCESVASAVKSLVTAGVSVESTPATVATVGIARVVCVDGRLLFFLIN